MTKVETIFAHELNLIHDKTIRDFVTTCFDKLCPDYFWTCPCSTTGKYHPQVSLGVGGLVRHTKLAVWWGLELIKALHDSPELKNIALHTLHDEIIATLLLHDMVKNGKGLNAQGYPLDRGVTGTHGVALAAKIVSEELDNELSLEPSERIFDGIAGHMGIWTTDPFYRPSKAFAQLIHLADYAASRKVDKMYRELEDDFEDQIDLELAKTALKRNDFVPLEKVIAELNKENDNDTNKKPTITTGKNAKINKSPACPGVRKTESCQTDSETDSQ